MSSHHFVKENQEPALLLISLENIPYRMLEGLLEWSPTIFVMPNALEKADRLGIKIDGLVVDQQMDMETIAQNYQHQLPFEQKQFAPFSLSEFTAFIAPQNPTLSVVGENSILSSEQYWKSATQTELIVYTELGKTVYCKSKYEKWLPAQSKLRCYFQHENLPTLKTENLDALLPDHFCEVKKDGTCSIASERPFAVQELYSE